MSEQQEARSLEAWMVCCDRFDYGHAYSLHSTEREALGAAETLAGMVGGEWYAIRYAPRRVTSHLAGKTLWEVFQSHDDTWEARNTQHIIPEDGLDDGFDYISYIEELFDNGEVVIAETEEEAIRLAEARERLKKAEQKG